MLLAIIGLGVAMTGCTTSHSTANKLTLHSHPQTTLNVMPFGAARKQFATGSASLFGLMTGADDYKFTPGDYTNFRSSIVKSLRQSGSFAGVEDVANASQKVTGLRLYVELETAGMKRTRWGFSCVLKAKTRVENEAGATLATKDIAVEAESLMTVGDAKNKGIRKFVSEVGGLLNDIKP